MKIKNHRDLIGKVRRADDRLDLHQIIHDRGGEGEVKVREMILIAGGGGGEEVIQEKSFCSVFFLKFNKRFLNRRNSRRRREEEDDRKKSVSSSKKDESNAVGDGTEPIQLKHILESNPGIAISEAIAKLKVKERGDW